MLDSNGCGNASEESMRNGNTQKTVGFGGDQIIWYSGMANKIKKLSPDTKLSFVFHIQIAAFWNAMTQYGTINDDTQVNSISIDKHANTNYYMGDGKVECKISQGGTPVEGGSVMVLSQADGSIQDAYIYLCHGLQPI